MPVVIAVDPSTSACPLWVHPVNVTNAPAGVNVELVCRAVSEALYLFSGARFCQREIQGRACGVLPRCGCWSGAVSRYGWEIDGWGVASWSCGCGSSSVLQLPFPTYAVSAVSVDGVLLAEGAYELVGLSHLVRQDGGVFSCCSSLTIPTGEVGTTEILFTFGEPVPAMGTLAALALAHEAVLWFANEDCKIPRGTTTINRPGVSYEVATLGAFLERGHTGIDAVDMFLAAVNPHGTRNPSGISAPGRW